MKFNTFKAIIVFALFILFASKNIDAYSGKTTHPRINNYATSQSDLDKILQDRYGFSDGVEELVDEKNVLKWIEKGGEKEDDFWPWQTKRGQVHS